MVGKQYKRWEINALLLGFVASILVCTSPPCIAEPEPLKPAPVTTSPLQLQLSVEPSVVIAHRPVTVLATFTAKKTTTLCLLSDPIAQFDFTLRKPLGQEISLQPIQSKLPDASLMSPFRKQGIYQRLVELAEGESYILKMNLSRRLRTRHLPVGEYILEGQFSLCHPDIFTQPAPLQREALQTYPGKTLAIKSPKVARFYQSD